MAFLLTALISLFTPSLAQQAGTLVTETHPAITWQLCTPSGCTMQSGKIVLDADWRWLHDKSGYTNCYTGNEWDSVLCPDPITCAQNCALDGADYSSTYGVTTSGGSLSLKLIANSPSGSAPGARVYLLGSDSAYYTFKPLNREFSFDVDVSQLDCGYNGALYLTSMDRDGGTSRFPNNKAGAAYGTGYCDASCPRSVHFINGEANVLGWTAATKYGGEGMYGSCCTEMDIWEANAISTALVAHPCDYLPQYRCYDEGCNGGNDGVCDSDGCDFNPYRNGNHTFYGLKATVDSSSTVTVVTQFLTSDGTDTGSLVEIRRFYVQNGRVISNSLTNFAGHEEYNSISKEYCNEQKEYFGDPNYFAQQGGLVQISSAMRNGMVLVFSLLGSYEDDYFWLDSDYPTDAVDPSVPGVARGTCPSTPGATLPVEGLYPTPRVTYSNIKFGTIGSTSVVVA